MLTARKLTVLVCYAGISWFGSSGASAFSSGPPSHLNGSTASAGATCAACHTDSAGGSGSVQIFGAPSAYEAGAIYNLTVRVSDPVQVGAGYQFSVEDDTGAFIGSLATTDANSQLNAGFINHTSAGVTASLANWGSLGDAAEYQFTWQAPASDAGEVTFWVIGNAINNAGGNSGDLLYLNNLSAGIAPGIPTVSEWGLIIMLMSLMTGGTVVMVRQRTNQVPARVRH